MGTERQGVYSLGDLRAEGSAKWTHGGHWEVGVLKRKPGTWQSSEPSTVAWGRGRRPVGERLSDFQGT